MNIFIVILNFIKAYWVQIIFCSGVVGGFITFASAVIEATKCTLRNDILAIYDKCKESKKITKYQLQAILYSYKIYKRLKGNSFVDEIVEIIKHYEIID